MIFLFSKFLFIFVTFRWKIEKQSFENFEEKFIRLPEVWYGLIFNFSKLSSSLELFIYINYERSITKISDLIIILLPILGSAIWRSFFSPHHLIIDMRTYLYLSIGLLFQVFFLAACVSFEKSSLIKYPAPFKKVALQNMCSVISITCHGLLSFLLLICRLFRILFPVYLIVH